MSNYDDDDNDGDGTVLMLALIGGSAVLAWLLLRGRGNGGRGKSSDGGAGASAATPAPKPVCIWLLDDDRIVIDGVLADLATAITIARRSGEALVYSRGDTRHGWALDVRAALEKAGVSLVIQGDTSGVTDGAHSRAFCAPPSLQEHPSRLTERICHEHAGQAEYARLCTPAR